MTMKVVSFATDCDNHSQYDSSVEAVAGNGRIFRGTQKQIRGGANLVTQKTSLPKQLQSDAKR